MSTFASRSESVLGGYRRDLEDLGSGLCLETVALWAAAARAASALHDTLEVGASVVSNRLESVGQVVDDLRATTAGLLSHANKALRSAEADGVDVRPSASLSTKKYTRFEAQVLALRADPATFTREPEDSEGFGKWSALFSIDEMKEQIETVLHESPGLESFVEGLVPSVNPVMPASVGASTQYCATFFCLSDQVSTVKSTILEVGNIELFELNEVLASQFVYYCSKLGWIIPKNPALPLSGTSDIVRQNLLGSVFSLANDLPEGGIIFLYEWGHEINVPSDQSQTRLSGYTSVPYTSFPAQAELTVVGCSKGLDAKGRWTRARVAQLTSNLSLRYTTVTFLASFEFGEENSNVFADLKDDNGSDSGINFDYNDPDMPNNIDVDLDVPTYPDEVSFCNGSIIHLHLWGYSPFASILYSCVATNILVA
ncbi:BSD domain-containing protein, partial [Zea mays]